MAKHRTHRARSLLSAAVLATLDEFESRDVIGHARELVAVIERGLSRLAELPAVANVRGEGVVWGVECAALPHAAAEQVAVAAVEACYLGDAADSQSTCWAHWPARCYALAHRW